MTEKNGQSLNHFSGVKTYRGILQTVGLMVALVASLATLTSVWLQVRRATPHVDVRLQSVQNLTSLPQIPQLKAEFKFDDRPVSDLWQIRISLINSGKKTLIGEGPQKNIVKDSVIISLNKGFKLLQLQTDSTDFPNEVKRVDESHFSVSFLQWRRNESLNLVAYLERIDRSIPRPTFFSQERYLVDGDVTFVDTYTDYPQANRALLDRLPPTVATALRSVSVVFFVALAVLAFILIGVATHEIAEFYIWRYKYYGEFAKIVRKEFPKKASQILREPWRSPNELWEKAPHIAPINQAVDTKSTYIIICLVFILIVLSCATGIVGVLAI